MTAPKAGKIVGANANFVTFCLFVIAMTCLLGPQLTGRAIENAQWYIGGCIAGLAGDAFKIAKTAFGGTS